MYVHRSKQIFIETHFESVKTENPLSIYVHTYTHTLTNTKKRVLN